MVGTLRFAHLENLRTSLTAPSRGEILHQRADAERPWFALVAVAHALNDLPEPGAAMVTISSRLW